MSTWRKSSYSNATNCIEAASWRISSRCSAANGCVEVGSGEAVVGVRDNTLEQSPVLVFADDWRRFLLRLKLAH